MHRLRIGNNYTKTLTVVILVIKFTGDIYFLKFFVVGASLVAQRLKRLPPMRETWVRSLGWEDPLEKEMVTYSSNHAWRIPWTEEPVQVASMKSYGHRCGPSASGWGWVLRGVPWLCRLLPHPYQSPHPDLSRQTHLMVSSQSAYIF